MENPKPDLAHQRRPVPCLGPSVSPSSGPCPRLQPCAHPQANDWLHEPKWDGFRFQIIKDGSEVRFYSRHGAEYTDRLPSMAEAFGKLPTQSAILDGELVLIDPRGAAHFYRLMAQMRTSEPDESQLMFLSSICWIRMALICAPYPYPSASATCIGCASNHGCRSCARCKPSPNGPVLFEHCSKFGFEGVVSKRLASRYTGGPSRNWVKTKCPGWKRINSEHYRLFEGPRKPALTEAQKTLARKRQELAPVTGSLRSPGSEPGHGARAAQECRQSRAGNR